MRISAEPFSESCNNLGRFVNRPYNARVSLDTHGAWKDHDPAEMVVWNDLDNDGYLTRDCRPKNPRP